ncbi:hypothetical protein CFC21_035049 [Triticum aestivum]|uniref:Uncharacterized protein n=2 Tax=Triticum aestivum TaxID=4565 RepID=A0A9R1F582_WHEAT|nr:hypothetical protein CFC21_035049 [Triticum aestivum]
MEVRKKKGNNSKGKKKKEGSRGVGINREAQGEGAKGNRSSSKEIQRRGKEEQHQGRKTSSREVDVGAAAELEMVVAGGIVEMGRYWWCVEREWMDDWVAQWLVGAPPRWPGRGGGRRWRRKRGREEMEMLGLIGNQGV